MEVTFHVQEGPYMESHLSANKKYLKDPDSILEPFRLWQFQSYIIDIANISHWLAGGSQTFGCN